ncbi:MAG: GerMN domain-containing protein [Treponema sp.]|nr:GerMN domain-containing protein [Treponema sp.]MBQ1590506.1 GerMN domain-containing protein [Treponema sp.]MBR4386971.1 GerMN domain-containing protein [Treponema sp.]
MAKKEEEKEESKTGSFIALVIWLIAAIALFALFVINQKKIVSNLKSTGFFGRLFGKTPAFVENAEVSVQDQAGKNDVDPGVGVDIDLSSGQGKGDYSYESGILAENQAAKDAQNNLLEPATLNSNKENTGTNGEQKPQTNEVPRMIDLKLFFMVINSDGSVSRREVTRSMKKTGGPLVDAINALIQGPSEEEEGKGCATLVSTGTRLLGASVKNGIATLNFSGEFEFNQWGIEGLRGQLQQIVYTATAFPTVESVQFLVDGVQKDYLGSEGVWIGTPLNRNSF